MGVAGIEAGLGQRGQDRLGRLGGIGRHGGEAGQFLAERLLPAQIPVERAHRGAEGRPAAGVQDSSPDDERADVMALEIHRFPTSFTCVTGAGGPFLTASRR
jgi:hypothetical protein